MQRKNFLTSVGIEPTTSGLDLPLLCRLSYEVAQRKSGTILRGDHLFFASCGSLIPFTGANAQWVIHGLISTLIYTSELILCSPFIDSHNQKEHTEFHKIPRLVLTNVKINKGMYGPSRRYVRTDFDIFKWLYFDYYWFYLHQTLGFCKAWFALYGCQ